jgi:hypothetical protein
MAQRIIHCLIPKWNPNTAPSYNSLWLTPRRQARNKQVEKTGNPILCDPNTLTENVADGFRIFTEPINADLNLIAPDHNAPINLQLTTVYTDGSCLTTDQGHTQAGSGVWFGVDDPRNKAYRVPGHQQTNQIVECMPDYRQLRMPPLIYPC